MTTWLILLTFNLMLTFLIIMLFRQVTATVTANLNKIIDVNHYPVETAKTSNMRHRPIGIGVQGLADAFILLGMPFDSPEVTTLTWHKYLNNFSK